uniref:Transcription elongation factor 1 homolog n=1 Tax=Acrobeloides nanus TaxID=290746 RepID=A0A914DFA0_9BILA
MRIVTCGLDLGHCPPPSGNPGYVLGDRERNVGFISCRVCLEDFQTNINYLSEAIDVYSDWIDACESANA